MCAFWAKNTLRARWLLISMLSTLSHQPKCDFGPLQNHPSDLGTKLWGSAGGWRRSTLLGSSAAKAKYVIRKILPNIRRRELLGGERERAGVRNLGSAFTFGSNPRRRFFWGPWPDQSPLGGEIPRHVGLPTKINYTWKNSRRRREEA